MLLKLALALSSALLMAAPPADDPLEALNAAFHGAYAVARGRALEHQGPVLLVSGDSLVLYRDQKVLAEAVVRPASYHRLKAVAHVPLALRLAVGAWGEGPLAPEQVARLEALRDQVRAARAGLADPGQDWILVPSLAYLDRVLEEGRVSLADLDGYSRSMGAPLAANAEASAAIQLEALAKVVPAWRREYLAADWDAVRVVIIGSHMARDGEISFQYFSRLLGQGREGDRLVFAEGLWEPKDALVLLASHRLDRGLGQAFFGDPGRLHQDVLAPAAGKWLDSHPPAP